MSSLPSSAAILRKSYIRVVFLKGSQQILFENAVQVATDNASTAAAAKDALQQHLLTICICRVLKSSPLLLQLSSFSCYNFLAKKFYSSTSSQPLPNCCD